MSHRLYKILVDDDGEKVKDKKWCLLSYGGDTSRTLCTGEAIDGSSIVEFDDKIEDYLELDTNSEELWREIFYSCLGNPRILGYILFY